MGPSASGRVAEQRSKIARAQLWCIATANASSKLPSLMSWPSGCCDNGLSVGCLAPPSQSLPMLPQLEFVSDAEQTATGMLSSATGSIKEQDVAAPTRNPLSHAWNQQPACHCAWPANRASQRAAGSNPARRHATWALGSPASWDVSGSRRAAEKHACSTWDTRNAK